MARHMWTKEENIFFCRRCVEEYIIKKNSTKVSDFISAIEKEMNYTIEKGSLKMKAQNVKYFLVANKIENTLEISPLSNCSKDNIEAMEKVLKELNISYSDS